MPVRLQDKEFMLVAIREAEKNIKRCLGGPFGACIVKNGKVISKARNMVLKNDPTLHAEILAIRRAAAKIKSFDLSGSIIYSTAEPCPMCFSAIHWARISRIVYGAGIMDARRFGFNEMPVSNLKMKRLSGTQVSISGGVLRDECLSLFDRWDKVEGRVYY